MHGSQCLWLKTTCRLYLHRIASLVIPWALHLTFKTHKVTMMMLLLPVALKTPFQLALPIWWDKGPASFWMVFGADLILTRLVLSLTPTSVPQLLGPIKRHNWPGEYNAPGWMALWNQLLRIHLILTRATLSLRPTSVSPAAGWYQAT